MQTGHPDWIICWSPFYTLDSVSYSVCACACLLMFEFDDCILLDSVKSGMISKKRAEFLIIGEGGRAERWCDKLVSVE